jgi:hypothetical protein
MKVVRVINSQRARLCRDASEGTRRIDKMRRYVMERVKIAVGRLAVSEVGNDGRLSEERIHLRS